MIGSRYLFQHLKLGQQCPSMSSLERHTVVHWCENQIRVKLNLNANMIFEVAGMARGNYGTPFLSLFQSLFPS